MTGYDAAVEWLRANAPEWRLVRSESRLEPGQFVGDATVSRYEVVLVEAFPAFPGSGDVSLHGEGGTILDAVQRAIGAIGALERRKG